MVLDGAVDPATSYAASAIAQSEGFESELDAFLQWCASHTECGFARGGNPRAALDSLASDVAAEPEPGTVHGEHRTLGAGEFDIGLASALYSGEDGYQDLGDALGQAARGVGDGMLRLADEYTERGPGGHYSNETAALYAIECLDAGAPRSVAAVQQLAATAARVAPHFGATGVWLGLPCTFWPVRRTDAPRPVHAPRAGPILVVGTTHDPATPYAAARSLARQLRSGRLLTYSGSGHTAYGRGSACVDDAVDHYLLTLTLPSTTAC
jgi:pimeloyl-ACP methyl ester carboxylesterase